MPKLKPSYGVSQVLSWKFQQNKLPDAWARHLGVLPQRFHIYVDGDGGQGKTEYGMQMSMMLANHFGKVRLNNVEQGKHPQITESAHRNNFKENIKPGKFAYSMFHDFEELRQKLRTRNSGRVIIIDSISYFPLNAKQIQELLEEFIHKSFILVAYKAHFNQNKAIQHLCDTKVRVENFIATTNGTSRFGGNEDYVIWDRPKKTVPQLSFELGTNGKH